MTERKVTPQEIIDKWISNSEPTSNWKESSDLYDEEELLRPKLVIKKRRSKRKGKKPFEIDLHIPGKNVPVDYILPKGILYFTGKEEEIIILYDLFQNIMSQYVLSQIIKDDFLTVEDLNKLGIPGFTPEQAKQIRNFFDPEEKSAYILWEIFRIRTYLLFDVLIKEHAEYKGHKDYRWYNSSKGIQRRRLLNFFSMLREPWNKDVYLRSLVIDKS